MTKMANTIAGNLLAAFFSNPRNLVQKKAVQPKRYAVDRDHVEHFFIGRPARDANGRILPKDGTHVPDPCSLCGPPRKHIRKSRELLSKWNVRVETVPVVYTTRVDRNKYTGAVLRDLRAQRGVGC